MGYGYVERRHFRKIAPWLLRLETATAGLREDMKAGDRAETIRSLEDVWFWVGRTICEVLAAQHQLMRDPALALRTQRAMGQASKISAAARLFLSTPT